MKLFINDKYVRVEPQAEFAGRQAYDLELSPKVPLGSIKLTGQVLIYDGDAAYMDALLTLMQVRKLKKLECVTFVTPHYEQVKEFVKSQFRIVKAAGGLVMKDNRYLMIHRLGVWDLPKGKLEKGEKTIEGAIREVEEECSIRVAAEEKLVSTWHTYVQDGRSTLKKTTWYTMYCLDDSSMTPQKEENIDDIRWMTRLEAMEALEGSYRSIQEVFNAFWESRVLN